MKILAKQRSLRVQTSCKDFDQIGIQEPDACTWAEFEKKLLYEKNLQVHKILEGKIFFRQIC